MENTKDEIREFLVLGEEEGDRLDVYLSSQLGEMSRSYIQKIIKDKKVKVNGKIEKAKYAVKEDDSVVIEIPAPKLLEVIPQDIPIDIVYEDDDLLIVNKPQDMVVHPAPGNYENTLVNAILYHCKDNLSSINGVIRPGIVHRIDMNTTGVLVTCKNDFAHSRIAAQLAVHDITRKYNAIVWNPFSVESGTVDAPLARSRKDRKKVAIDQSGRRAVTHYRVLKNFKQFAHVECQLETGRTHQIRVHMSSIGHPLLGDDVYGNGKSPYNITGQALHARVLGFVHPRTGKYMEFEAPLPDYFQKILNDLESNGR